LNCCQNDVTFPFRIIWSAVEINLVSSGNLGRFCMARLYIVYIICSGKSGFWVKMPKIDRPGSQDFQHLGN
jgi:hypothetical protein